MATHDAWQGDCSPSFVIALRLRGLLNVIVAMPPEMSTMTSLMVVREIGWRKVVMGVHVEAALFAIRQPNSRPELSHVVAISYCKSQAYIYYFESEAETIHFTMYTNTRKSERLGSTYNNPNYVRQRSFKLTPILLTLPLQQLEEDPPSRRLAPLASPL